MTNNQTFVEQCLQNGFDNDVMKIKKNKSGQEFDLDACLKVSSFKDLELDVVLGSIATLLDMAKVVRINLGVR